MTRQEANRAIVIKLSEMVEAYPDLRFGQILCNYIFPKLNLPIFYEESTDTLKGMNAPLS